MESKYVICFIKLNLQQTISWFVFQLPVEPEYYTLFTMAEDGKESNDGGEKSSKTESDKVAEIEAKQLEDDKIVDYDIPAFEDSKPVGKYL